MAVFLSSFLPDSDPYSKLQLVEEGFGELSIENENSPYKLVGKTNIQAIFQARKAFSHKGTYGHALLIAGDIKTMGAALLCASGCLYGGAGLTTAAIPESGLTALNTLLPEVMYIDRGQLVDTDSLKKYNAIAVGPGLGKSEEVIDFIKTLVLLKQPIVIDADALNILAEHKKLSFQLAKNAIYTPHMKEFDGLFGKHDNWWARLQTARKMAKELDSVIVLKNQYTFVVDQQSNVLINSTGNPAMAQGGMGDVLTGLIAAYVAQGYSTTHATLLGCYFHGMAGDELAISYNNITASKLAAQIPITVKTFLAGF